MEQSSYCRYPVSGLPIAGQCNCNVISDDINNRSRRREDDVDTLSLCSSQYNKSCHHNNDGAILIVGANNFIGARLSLYLHAKLHHDVVSVASQHDISEDRLLWYKLDQLLANGINIDWINLTNSSHASELFTHKHFNDVYYITPEGITDIHRWSNYLKDFVTLLEVLRRNSPCSRLVLISSDGWDNPVDKAWLRTFELTGSTYHSLYMISFVSIRLSGVYGPWGRVNDDTLLTSHSTDMPSHPFCWYIAVAVETIVKILRDSRMCTVIKLNCDNINDFVNTTDYNDTYSIARGIGFLSSWLHAYRQQRARQYDVIFTSYFTTEVDPQRRVYKRPNRYSYISQWFDSLMALHLRAVIFHDGLDQGFMDRLSHIYHNVSFHRVTSLYGRSTNDARFYAYHNYLKRHPDIRRVLMTDISDVVFQRNPFDLMNLLGDLLYIGTDIDIFPDMLSMPWLSSRLARCFGNYSVLEGDLHDMMRLAIVYNAGVLGGSRHIAMALLTRITWALDHTPPDINCNMPAVNYVVHKYFNNITYTGHPLTSRFLRFQCKPRAVYIVHK